MGNKLDFPSHGAHTTATACTDGGGDRTMAVRAPTLRTGSPPPSSSSPSSSPKTSSKAHRSTSPHSTTKKLGTLSPTGMVAASGAGISSGVAGPGHSPTIVLRSLDSEGESPRGEGEGRADVECEVTDILRRYSHVGGKAVSIKDFDLLKVLGKGSFGKVMLVRFKGSRELHAMKTLRKEALIRRSQLAHTSTERYILQHIHHPFLMKLSYAFQTKQKLYMVVDYMAGGELFFWLKKGRFGESRAKLYAAEITCALEALHKHNIVYRDLKPENILLDADGHIRLTDFGLSKANVTGYGISGGAHTFCGTPEYLAPEILENRGHGKGIDWWSLGTLLYEMICGLPPFYDQNVQKMYKKILTASLLPSHKALSEDAKSLVAGLLERKVAHRLGCGATGALEIKQHPFFAGLDWQKVTERRYQPEFVPPKARRRSVDVDNFDKEFTQEVCADSVVHTTLTAQQEELANFEGFTYDPRGGRLR